MALPIFIEELGDGRVLVQLATGIAVALRPVAEVNEGESYAGIPYGVWAAHAGEVVDTGALERERDAGMSATVLGDFSPEAIARLRTRTGLMFGILAAVASMHALWLIISLPSAGYLGVLVLPFAMFFGLLAFLWAGATGRMLTKRVSVARRTTTGWAHIIVGLLVVLQGATFFFKGWGAEGRPNGVYFLAIGAILIEAGRVYLRLWWVQDVAASRDREVPGLSAQ